MFMRASRASELEHFGNLHFFQYFVGTSDILSVQMICLSANMYRQISKCTDKTPKKHYWGGGAVAAPAPYPPPPPPPLATLVHDPFIHPIHPAIHSFIHPSIHSFTLPFIHSFMHPSLAPSIILSTITHSSWEEEKKGEIKADWDWWRCVTSSQMAHVTNWLTINPQTV